MFLHTGLPEFDMFFMTRCTTFLSSTLFVIPQMVFFLTRRESSEEEATLRKLRRKLATMLKMCCVTDIFLGTWSKFTEKLF